MAISLKEKFKKANAKSSTISIEDPEPKFWLSSGNKLINKIISGRFDRGYGQGKIVGFSGLSGAGKSFLIASAIKEAHKNNYIVAVIDTENALDESFMSGFDIDTSEDNPNYIYASVNSFSAAWDAINQLIEDYFVARKNGTLDQMQPLLIVCDSLDAMMTDSMLERAEEKGELGSDQGLQARKQKQLLHTIMSQIKVLPVICLCTKQVYVDQTPHANPPVKMAEAVKFYFQQLLLLSRRMAKDEKTKAYYGIHLRVFAWKTRGCKPFQQCDIDIPYDDGMDEYEGLLQIAAQMGIVQQAGSWFTYKDFKWQGADKWRHLDTDVKEEIFQEIVKIDIEHIDTTDDTLDEVQIGLTEAAQAKSKKKAGTTASAVDKIAARKAAREEAEEGTGD